MKRDYSAPKAEKIEFDYIESVVACPSYVNVPVNAAPGPGVYYACVKCYTYDNWLDSTGKCKGHY